MSFCPQTGMKATMPFQLCREESDFLRLYLATDANCLKN